MSNAESMPHFVHLDRLTLPRTNLSDCHYLFFSPKTLAAAIVQRQSLDSIKNYLQSYDREHVRDQISEQINGTNPVAFYAAKHVSLEIMELLLEYGVDPNIQNSSGIPLLAAAIMMTNWTYKSIDRFVTLLLSHGADPHCIPEYMWTKYIKMPKDNYSSDYKPHPSAAWAKKQHRVVLEKTLNLTIRYQLHRASLLSLASKRQRQIVELTKCPQILRLPFHIIGQDQNLEIVLNKIMAYDAMNRKRPLVLAFAGLSGHGKTELATSMGYLLGTDICNVDMSKTRTSMSLFGAPAPYCGSEHGSPLNNYLAENQGQRTVVFLDEFDKTTQEVREALLTVLDSGDTLDLRNNSLVDAKKSIWILASNKGDDLISRFYDKNLEGKTDSERRKISIRPLQNDLFKLFKNEFTPAVTGRISEFLPFFPFSRDEAAVVSHKFLIKLGDQIRKPLNLEAQPPSCVGHLYLSLLNDGDVCKFLSETYYIRDLGARSIQNCVDGLADMLFKDYAESDVEITEDTNKTPFTKYTLQLHPVADTHEVGVREDGKINIPSE